MKAYLLHIHGLVQGVYFRQSTRDMAIKLEINGTVKNCTDGSVEIFAEGEENNLHEFIEWCRSGPKRAKVERVDIHEQPLKNFETFMITR